MARILFQLKTPRVKHSFRRWSFQNSLFIFLNFIFQGVFSQQPANYVNNGSFEVCGTCGISSFKYPKFWGATDSLKYYCQYFHKTLIPNSVPLNSFAYQWPRTGDGYIISLQFCPTCP